MKRIFLGDCCSDCFAAVNYNPAELPPAAAETARAASEKLSLLCDKEKVVSLSTGVWNGFKVPDPKGPGGDWCDGCGSSKPSDFWQLIGLKGNGNGKNN